MIFRKIFLYHFAIKNNKKCKLQLSCLIILHVNDIQVDYKYFTILLDCA